MQIFDVGCQDYVGMLCGEINLNIFWQLANLMDKEQGYLNSLNTCIIETQSRTWFEALVIVQYKKSWHPWILAWHMIVMMRQGRPKFIDPGTRFRICMTWLRRMHYWWNTCTRKIPVRKLFVAKSERKLQRLIANQLYKRLKKENDLGLTIKKAKAIIIKQDSNKIMTNRHWTDRQ